MVDGTGEGKKGRSGLTGPKHNLSKQTSLVSTLRKYYNANVPRGSNWKPPKTPRSPSMEPVDLISTGLNQTNSNNTNTQSSHEPNKENTVRPITPTNSTPPAAETTPCPNRTKKYNQDEVDKLIMVEMEEAEHAMEIAADANLDYIEISERMCNILQDVEDIMSNQLTDVFQLSNWVTTLIDTFGLKVCDDLKWKSFSNHYNHITGEVTTFNPIHKTSYTTNDSPMNEADRDELTKACEELDSAQTTIKNLSEAVVNFSCNSNILVLQEKEEYTLQYPTTQTVPQPNTTPAPKWTKSANPMVIKPTQNVTSKTTKPAPDTTPKPKANPH